MKEKFINEVEEAIKERFGKGFHVQFYEIVKDENTVVPAAVIFEPGATTSVAVHVGQLLESLENNKDSLADAAWKVVKICEEVQNVSSYVDVIATPTKREILLQATYHLVNTEKNMGKLMECPHKDMLDLSAVYSVTVKDNGIETASIIVDNDICEGAGISEAELDNAANLNTDLKGFRTQPFDSVFPGVLDGMGIDAGCLWVLASRLKNEGAAIMLYPGYFRKLARRLGKDLYVVPSSRHEVIAAPVNSSIAPDDLKSIASKINSVRVTHGETISKNVYRYRRRAGKFEIMNT